MKLLIALVLGKLIASSSKFLKIGGGSAAPGLYALKVHPNLVEDLIKKIPQNVVITGTNGKTTTAKMLAHFAQAHNLKVIRNYTGSNLERGIASTLVSSVHLRGASTNFDLGIWELDEAAFNNIAPKIKPDIVVFLNIFRDQLDRYGEVNSVLRKWYQTIKKFPKKTVILINGDDLNTLKLAQVSKGEVKIFGVESYKILGEGGKKSNSILHFEAKNIKTRGLKGISFSLTIKDELLTINLPIPGTYHIYNALAAISAAYHLNLPINKLTSTLKHYSPAFGRVEKLDFGYIFLIKNPTGATQVFETLAPNLGKNDRLLIALNDNLADGTDVSWIWDVNFEVLQNSSRAQPRDLSLYVSGSRAEDLAVRLKYAGFEPKQIKVEPNLKRALEAARKGLKGKLFILPTYTALLQLQSILTKSGIKKNYWEQV